MDLPPNRFTRAALALALATILGAPACSQSSTPTSLVDACTLFYSHLNGGAAECAGCANAAPAACNRPGIDAACSAMKSCASANCVGAQCSCSGLAQCMADAGDACVKALQDYYQCSNAGCASSCGGSSGACGDGTCAPGETCTSCPSDCGTCTSPTGCDACYPYETCTMLSGLPYCEHGVPCHGIAENGPNCDGGCCWSYRAVDGNRDMLQLDCAPVSACGITPPPIRCINQNGAAARSSCTDDAQCCSNNCHVGNCDAVRKLGDPCEIGVDLCYGYCGAGGVCTCDAAGVSCGTPGSDGRCCSGVCDSNDMCAP